MSSESIEWNGHKWYRYPDSKRRSDRVYFKRTLGVGRVQWLHRAIWEHHRGPIPRGHHVHHQNGNSSDNNIENLECIPGEQHLSEHARAKNDAEPGWWKRGLEAARVAAPAWHASEEGRKWHSENGKRVAAAMPLLPVVCVVCGADFQSKRGAQVCSNKCFARQRRDSGADDIEHKCPFCGRVYVASKYTRQKHCSRACALRNRVRPERERGP